jgi:hypothetical protein
MLRDERNRRWEQERQLRDERNRRIECEEHLRGGPGDNEGRARSAAAFRDAGYAPTVAKLLALAISSESDSEALAAFTKARSLHHQGSLSYPGLWHPAVQTAGTGIIFRTETSPGPAAESRAQAGLVCLRLGIEPAVALHNVPAT